MIIEKVAVGIRRVVVWKFFNKRLYSLLFGALVIDSLEFLLQRCESIVQGVAMSEFILFFDNVARMQSKVAV